MKDKYSAVWISHSSISDYLKCPRAYYLKNVYRDPKNNHKITIMQPSLALGQVVHDLIESLSVLPVEDRFTTSPSIRFEELWGKISGRLGGFRTKQEEESYKGRGIEMIRRMENNPGPLADKAIKIRQDLPYYWLSEEDNIILCGKIDWLAYKAEDDSVTIIDFKTGKFDEDPDSFQLPIYYLLATHCQSRQVSGLQYWYLDRDDAPVDVPFPDVTLSEKRLIEIAKKIALARKLGHFKCGQSDGCRVCRPLESILTHSAEFVGINDYNQDVYVLP